MKEHKEGIYVIGNTWAKGTENDRIWSYIECITHKTLNILHLQNMACQQNGGKVEERKKYKLHKR